MTATHYILIANVAVWLGIGAYVFFIGKGQQRLDARLKQLELLQDDTNDK